MSNVFEDLIKMDPALAQALANIRAGKAGKDDANIVSRQMFTDTLVPRVGNKFAYNDFLKSHANDGTHVSTDMVDFGQINKRHGFETGDQAIKDSFNTMADVSRQFGGKLFRVGGDEGRMWFPRPEAAHGFAREVRARFEKLPKAGGTHNLSVSIGIGHTPEHAESAQMVAKQQLGSTDPVTGKRINSHAPGDAPTVIHSNTHEPPPLNWKPAVGKPPPLNWKPAVGKPRAPAKETPALAPAGMKFHNPLVKAWPKDEAENQANMGATQVFQDHANPEANPNAKVRGVVPTLPLLNNHGIEDIDGYRRASYVEMDNAAQSSYSVPIPNEVKPALLHSRMRQNVQPMWPDDENKMWAKDELEPSQVKKPIPPKDHPALSGGQFGILTAENPMHPVTQQGGNQALEQELRQRKIHFEPVTGKYGPGPKENGFLLHDVDHNVMTELGQKYGQDSVIHSKHGVHKMIFTNGPQQGTVVSGQGHVVHAVEPESFYSTVEHQGKPTHFTLNFD